MNTLIIGDLHGDAPLFQSILAQFPKHYYVLLGDLVDSFTFGKRLQRECVDIALDLVRNERATYLIGNHELSYLQFNKRCAGWNDEMQRLLLPVIEEMRAVIKPFAYLEYHDQKPLLITHAGLTSPLVTHAHIYPIQLANKLTEWYQQLGSPFYYVSELRGGDDLVGGPLWCDVREFRPVDWLRQVFGHTPLQEMATFDGNNFCIDTLQSDNKSVLELSNGKLTPIKIHA